MNQSLLHFLYTLLALEVTTRTGEADPYKANSERVIGHNHHWGAT